MGSLAKLVAAVVLLLSGVTASIAVSATPAGAAGVLYVGVPGIDGSNNCLVRADPCATIDRAVSLATSGDTIQVAAGTYDQTVVVDVANLTISGQGPSTVIYQDIADQATFQLDADGTSLTMMSISGGEGDGNGDAIDNVGNSSTIEKDSVTDSHGSGIANTGDDVTIADDLVAGNDASGIRNQGNSVDIIDDTITDNFSSDGGGLWSSGTGVTVMGDTITTNESRADPGGYPSGIDSQGPVGSLTVAATILSGNYAAYGGPTCAGPLADGGYNLEYDGTTDADSCGFSTAGHDLIDLDPRLGEQAWWGGPTPTQAVPSGSPVQGAIPADSPLCDGTDQRGAPRLPPGSAACDMGAFQSSGGYWEVASDGGIFAFHAPFFGSMGGKHLAAPVVGMAEDPTTGGYWEVAADGGIFAYNAPFDGSMSGEHLAAPIVGIAANLKGGGYWLVAADGGIFAFGGAPFFGSMGGQALNAPIVDMAADPASGGYWLVAADGGVFAFGGAAFYGSMGGQHLSAPVVGVAGSSCGYWEVAGDGGVFSFPDTDWCAPFVGSMGGQPLHAPVVGVAGSDNGLSSIGDQGYWEVASDGGIFAFNVPFYGSMGGTRLDAPIVGMASG
jgi:hypothetical protein